MVSSQSGKEVWSTALMSRLPVPHLMREGHHEHESKDQTALTIAQLLVISCQLPPTACHPRLATHGSPPTARHPRLATHGLQPTACHPRLTTHGLPPTACHPRLAIHGLPPMPCHAVVEFTNVWLVFHMCLPQIVKITHLVLTI